MKIIVFNGGLGNQLFEFAYYQYLKGKFPTESFYAYIPQKAHEVHNGIEIEKWFEAELPMSCKYVDLIAKIIILIDKVFRHLAIPIHVLSSDSYFSENKLLQMGTFQKKSFCKYASLHFKKYEDLGGEENINLLKMIHATNSVAVHVRRGDYLIPELKKQYGGLCTLSYYQKAIAEINKRIDNPMFFFFSDDPVFVEKHFLFKNKIVVSCNSGNRSFYDLYLMSHCKNMIIANSTFSWWAAFLNKNVEKVYCPIRWNNIKPYPDLVMDGWQVVNP